MPDLTYRPTEPRDVATVNAILAEAFSNRDEIESINAWTEGAGLDLMRTCELDGRIVGTVRFTELGQYFARTRTDMTGIVGVAIAPEARAGGVGGQIMRACLREMRDNGTPISVLYASTSAFYRTLGYETAGALFTHRVPLELVPKRPASLTVRPYDEKHEPAVRACYESVARERDGYLSRNGYIWERIRNPKKKPTHGYVFEREGGDIEGYAFHRQVDKPDVSFPMELAATDLVATTPAAVDTLFAHLRGYASMCTHVEFEAGPTDPIVLALTQQRAEASMVEHWMLRIINVEKALSQRGYRDDANETIAFKLTDKELPENDGVWTLRINKGSASVEASGKPTLQLSARALAAMYTGYASARELRTWSDLACNDEATLDACDRLFRGPSPGMSDMF